MKQLILIVTAALAIAILSSEGVGGDKSKGSKAAHKVLSFHTMYAVDGPFLDPANAIDGVEGDDLPWVIESARGSLDSKGHLKLQVKGLVFSDDDKVPPELQGINDEAEFRAVVTCLTETEDDQVELATVVSEGFKATIDGDSHIDAQLELPDPCIRPVVFVISGKEDKWFAVTGVEVEEEE
jgi:hypothetical protein